jgi:hypothetical protein
MTTDRLSAGRRGSCQSRDGVPRRYYCEVYAAGDPVNRLDSLQDLGHRWVPRLTPPWEVGGFRGLLAVSGDRIAVQGDQNKVVIYEFDGVLPWVINRVITLPFDSLTALALDGDLLVVGGAGGGTPGVFPYRRNASGGWSIESGFFGFEYVEDVFAVAVDGDVIASLGAYSDLSGNYYADINERYAPDSWERVVSLRYHQDEFPGDPYGVAVCAGKVYFSLDESTIAWRRLTPGEWDPGEAFGYGSNRAECDGAYLALWNYFYHVPGLVPLDEGVLSAPTWADSSRFHQNIALRGSLVAAGAPTTNPAGRSHTLLYTRNHLDFTLVDALLNAGATSGPSAFGTGVALSGDWLVVGVRDGAGEVVVFYVGDL